MQERIIQYKFIFGLILMLLVCMKPADAQTKFSIYNEYFDKPGLSVLVFNDLYTEGHQGGIQIIQHEERIAANGDLRLEQAPGQWQPFSQVNEKTIDTIGKEIFVSLSYPNDKAQTRYFNRIEYPDLELEYTIRVQTDSTSFRIIVDLDKSLPEAWIGKVGFNLELFPGSLFGKNYMMDNNTGQFPRQFNGPSFKHDKEQYESKPMAEGRKLVIAPEWDLQRLTIESLAGQLDLIDGRAQHNNGWFIVRSLVSKGATKHAVEWIVTPNVIPSWKYRPVIHINQLGYLSKGLKKALIECDNRDTIPAEIQLEQILPSGKLINALVTIPENWGIFGRYQYYSFDFSKIEQPGIYRLTCNGVTSEHFRIDTNIFDGNAWQPTLSYFLPVQMCHMRINDRYKVWHGLCHMDDARMAPPNALHFDGYFQGESTLTAFEGGIHVPGLNKGGWHDAGDYDLRVESQAGTMYALALIYEAFLINYDETTIDQANHRVELHQPDGKADILQQIEHGALSIVSGYRNLGRLYRGIICPDLRQYVMLGDGSTMTNNVPFDYDSENMPTWFENIPDDRWVFTENNPRRELEVASDLAASARILAGYNDTLATSCLEIAKTLWENNKEQEFPVQKTNTLVELFLTTEDEKYLELLLDNKNIIWENISRTAWSVSRILQVIDDTEFQGGFDLAIQKYLNELESEASQNPFGIPYKPGIWGAGWGIQYFAVGQYYLYKNLGIDQSKKYVMRTLDFVLGIHPGSNTASFVSGVGVNSATVAYGLNRDDWSYIPGGVISGTAIVKPDFPELKEWPYLWQQTEYMVSGAASNYMFLLLAAKEFSEE
jgi:endoglucanase